jgi:hypothetical protein
MYFEIKERGKGATPFRKDFKKFNNKKVTF